MKRHYQAVGDPLDKQLVVRKHAGKRAFRFWQEGAGYHRNLSEPKSIAAAIDYIHLNPVRRGLVSRARDWKWSSCRWYLSDKEEMDSDLPTIHGLPEPIA